MPPKEKQPNPADPTDPKQVGEIKVAWTNQVEQVLDEHDAALVIAPVGVGNPDDVETIGLIVSPEVKDRKAVSFLVAGIPGTPTYEVVDLNNLPEHMQVRIEFRFMNTGAISASEWHGRPRNDTTS